MGGGDKTRETKELLNKIYNSEHTVNKKISGSFLRRNIFKQYNLLLDQINQYTSPVATDMDKSSSLERMKVLINKSWLSLFCFHTVVYFRRY